MRSKKRVPWRGGESGRLFTVVARFETDDGHPALSGLEFFRAVPPEGETGPAPNGAARNPGGDPV